MLRISGLTKTFYRGKVDIPVLLGIDLAVRPGEMVAIMGPSGSGKSTLLHILGLLERADGGSFLLDGVDVTDLDDFNLSLLRNRKIGFVFQAFHLLPKADALNNVLLPFTYTDPYPPQAREMAVQALERVGLGHRLHHLPGEMSGGEQQRVAVARALVTSPEIILADEPTGNLDRKASLEVMTLFQELNRQGQTTVLVTHDSAVGDMCGRVVRLYYGRVDQDQIIPAPVDASRLLAADAAPQP
jgi:ABC-type lipoprotein export system ATPase subunit